MPFTSRRPALDYKVEGQGPPVVLSHALGCHLGMWDAVVPALANAYTVVRFDTRSHGQSELVTTRFTIQDLVGDAVDLMNELDLKVVDWVGLSMGGMIGQGLAIGHPDRIRRLVLANTTSRYSPEVREAWAERAYVARTEGMSALAGVLMTRWFSPSFRTEHPDVVERFKGDLLRMNNEGYAACCEAIATLDYHSRLRTIRSPTLVIAGEADVSSPVAAMRDIASAISGSRLEVVPRVGHLSAVERPDAFGAMARGFFELV